MVTFGQEVFALFFFKWNISDYIANCTHLISVLLHTLVSKVIIAC